MTCAGLYIQHLYFFHNSPSRLGRLVSNDTWLHCPRIKVWFSQCPDTFKLYLNVQNQPPSVLADRSGSETEKDSQANDLIQLLQIVFPHTQMTEHIVIAR